MKLENKSPRRYIAYDVILEANSTQEVTDKKAIEVLLKQEGVSEFADVKKLKEQAKEIEKLQKELELEKAKAEATELGIKFNPNIGLAKLLEKIEEAKK